MLSIIVAVASNWAIGKENNLLWHISEDLKFFKRTTLGSPIIMGYNTFLSLGSKALPKRRNIVINRNVEEAPAGVEFVRSLDEAVALVKDEPQAFIIGGGRIYAAALDIVDQLYVTHVDTAIEDADTFFPDLTQTKWRQSETTPWSEDPESGLRYRFAIYNR